MINCITKLVIAALVLPTFTYSYCIAADEDIYGTYRIVRATYTYQDNGEVDDAIFGKNPTGYMNFGSDGRMIALVAYGGRIKPENTATATIEQRDSLFRTMFAYAGTYTISGNKIEHHLDVTWNESWTGTNFVRFIERKGDIIILTTPPYPLARNNRIVTGVIEWQKIKP